MTALEFLVPVFLRAELAGGAGVLAVLAFRNLTRRWFGAELAWRLWIAPLVTASASLFPTLRAFIEGVSGGPYITPGWAGTHAALLAEVWLGGAGAMSLAMAAGEWRFRREARQGRAGPAVVGVTWPRMVVPHDYHARFTAAERGFIREHERAHMRRGDAKSNLLIAALQAVSWFNPLVHVAAAGARLDQELACDAQVIERHPGARRAYGEALLKAGAPSHGSPLACFWSLGASHPLELRIRLLARGPVSLKRYMTGACAISALWVACALLLWGLA